MTTIHGHSNSHSTGSCNSERCRTKHPQARNINPFSIDTSSLIMLGTGFLAVTALPKIISGVVNAVDSDNNSFIGGDNNIFANRSSEEIQADIDEITNTYGDKEAINASIAEINIESLENGVSTAKENLKTANKTLEGYKDNLKAAEKSLRMADPDDPNYVNLVRDVRKFQADIKTTEDAIKNKKAELEEAEAALKTKKEEKANLENALRRLEKLDKELERAKKAEAKEKRATEIDHLKNGETATISRLVKEYTKYEKAGKEEEMQACLDDITKAVNIYKQEHPENDNPAMDEFIRTWNIKISQAV